MLEPDSKAKVVVFLAAHNGGEYIVEQLESIFLQYDVSITIFVNIDKSEDNTYDLVFPYSKKYNLTILSSKNRYGSAAKNFFHLIREIDFSRFDYISFSDQDDIWYPEKLSKAIDVMSEKKCDGYSSAVDAFWDNGKIMRIDKSQPQKRYDHLFESAGPGCTYVLTTNFAQKIKDKLSANNDLVDKLWIHDWFIYSFARHEGFNWLIDSYSSMKYRQHNNNAIGANSGWSSINRRINVMLNGEGFKKVINQAIFIGQDTEKPVQLLLNKNRLSYLKLAFYCCFCRRRFVDQLFFFLVCIYFFFTGYKDNDS